MLHEVLTVKDDKDQHFTYRRSKVGLHANIPQYSNDTTGLIHKTITRTIITKLFGLRHLQLVKKRRASGWADKKVGILTFSTSTYSKHGKAFLSRC